MMRMKVIQKTQRLVVSVSQSPGEVRNIFAILLVVSVVMFLFYQKSGISEVPCVGSLWGIMTAIVIIISIVFLASALGYFISQERLMDFVRNPINFLVVFNDFSLQDGDALTYCVGLGVVVVVGMILFLSRPVNSLPSNVRINESLYPHCCILLWDNCPSRKAAKHEAKNYLLSGKTPDCAVVVIGRKHIADLRFMSPTGKCYFAVAVPPDSRMYDQSLENIKNAFPNCKPSEDGKLICGRIPVESITEGQNRFKEAWGPRSHDTRSSPLPVRNYPLN